MYHSKVELIHLLLLIRLIHQGNTAFLCRQSLPNTLMKNNSLFALTSVCFILGPTCCGQLACTKRLGYLGYAHQKRAARVKLIVILRITTVLLVVQLTAMFSASALRTSGKSQFPATRCGRCRSRATGADTSPPTVESGFRMDSFRKNKHAFCQQCDRRGRKEQATN